MSDLINRKDALCFNASQSIKIDDTLYVPYIDWYSYLSNLPPAEPKVNEVGDLISREYMKSLGGACIAQRLKDGDLCPIISIDLLPSAQPERKKGKWIYNSPVTMKCNQCGLVIKDWDWHRFKYCPNCCAKMEVKND